MKRILGLIIINIVFIIIFSLTTPYFFTKENIVVMIDNMALEAVALSGYTLLLIGGHFDLSIDGIVSLSGIVAGLSMKHGVSWVLATIFGLSCGIGIGALNGWIVAKLRINGLIATLTTWWICIGISLGTTKALSPYGFPEPFQMLGQMRILGFRSLVIYALLAVVLLSIVLHRTVFGAHVYGSGDNRVVAELMGINTAKLGIELYILVGLLAGFIGIMTASRLNAASPVAVDGMALRIIAAMVIGGCRLNGGEGTIIGGILGLSLMHILSNAAIQFGVSPYWQKAMLGSILLVAVLSEKVNLKLKRRTINV